MCARNFDEEKDDPIEYLYENADYDVTPKPERCSTLLTNYNIKTTGIVIGENLMSHVFALNTMGNNVIHIESQIVVIQSRMQEMQEQIDKISAEMGWWQLGRTVMETIINVAGGGVMKWVGSGLKIAASGIQNALKVSFSKNVVEMEDIFIEGIINAGEILASEQTKELTFIISVEGENDTEYKYELSLARDEYKLYIESGDVINEYTLTDNVWVINGDNNLNINDLTWEIPYITFSVSNDYEISNVYVKWIPKGNHNLGVNDEYSDHDIMTAAAVKKFVENHMNTLNEKYALKSELPEDVDLSGYVSTTDLSNQLSNYVSNTNLSEQLLGYALKTELPDTSTYLDTNGILSWDITRLSEIFKLGSCGKEDGTWFFIEDNNRLGNGWYINSSADRLLFELNSTSVNPSTVMFSDNGISFKGDKLISESELQQSMTITHLAPIDEELDINSFVIGAPVYMTGSAYVKENKRWNKSTVNDSIDCIPSVKTNGTWKEYLGICTHILPETRENGVLSHNRGEIKFATHGDYLVKVDDSSTYGIGDTVYIEHVIRDNISIPVLKILSEDIPLTTKINRMTVGIVTSIIDSKTISVIKD